MKEFYREYFTGNFERIPEGYMSWQHILVILLFVGPAVYLAIHLGKKYRNEEYKIKLKPIAIAAVLIDSFELLKIVLYCINAHSISALLGNLPLFLCSILLFSLPLAAFTKGRFQQAMIDFTLIFGFLAGSVGIAAAVQIYNGYPVVHFHPICSAITHTISLFASIYIISARLATLKRENIWIVTTSFAVFMFMALIANILQGGQYNYMFMWRSDGTPFIIFENLFGAPSVLYIISDILLMFSYLAAAYGVSYLIMGSSKKRQLVSAGN